MFQTIYCYVNRYSDKNFAENHDRATLRTEEYPVLKKDRPQTLLILHFWTTLKIDIFFSMKRFTIEYD